MVYRIGGGKKYYTFQPPHGYNTGILKQHICPTINSLIDSQHILLVEQYNVSNGEQATIYSSNEGQNGGGE